MFPMPLYISSSPLSDGHPQNSHPQLAAISSASRPVHIYTAQAVLMSTCSSVQPSGTVTTTRLSTLFPSAVSRLLGVLQIVSSSFSNVVEQIVLHIGPFRAGFNVSPQSALVVPSHRPGGDKRYELTKEQWERVKPLLPPEETGKRGRLPARTTG